MKVKKSKKAQVEVELTLSENQWSYLDELAEKNKITTEELVNLILDCEMDIMYFAVKKRKELAKRLKGKADKGYLFSHCSFLNKL